MSIKFGDVTVDAAYNTHYDFVFVRWLIVVVVFFLSLDGCFCCVVLVFCILVFLALPLSIHKFFVKSPH